MIRADSSRREGKLDLGVEARLQSARGRGDAEGFGGASTVAAHDDLPLKNRISFI